MFVIIESCKMKIWKTQSHATFLQLKLGKRMKIRSKTIEIMKSGIWPTLNVVSAG